MHIKLVLILLISTLFTGCASVPMESKELSDQVKQFNLPPADQSGLYIFRYGSFGGALKKDVWVDGECIGETAPDTFFYVQVKGGKEHTISTESEFSPNDLKIYTDGGENYFIRQFIKFGIFVGGAGLELVDAQEGMDQVSELGLAKKGTCSVPRNLD